MIKSNDRGDGMRIDELITAFENVVGVLLVAAVLSALGTAVWMLTW